MIRLFSCPRCRRQNFASRERLRLVRRKPLKCWKCGAELESKDPKKGGRKGPTR